MKVVGRNKRTLLMFNNLIFENLADCEIMWKNILEPDSPYDNVIQRMRSAC